MEHFDTQEILLDIRQTLQDHSDPKRILSSARFFKEGEQPKVYGIPAAQVAQIAKETIKLIKHFPKNQIFPICDELWESGYFEEAYIACQLSLSLKKTYQAEDLHVFKYWLENHVDNWAACDTLCCGSIGQYLLKFPDRVTEVMSWVKSENRWMRRGAAVSLIIPARRGKFLKEAFQIADQLKLDSDPMVQKGYGWLLKESSKTWQDEVFNYILQNKSDMPRTALRYAIEKMPTDLKAQAMKKD